MTCKTLSFVRVVPKLFLSAGGGAAGKLDNLHRDTKVLCCKGLSFRDLESLRAKQTVAGHDWQGPLL